MFLIGHSFLGAEQVRLTVKFKAFKIAFSLIYVSVTEVADCQLREASFMLSFSVASSGHCSGLTSDAQCLDVKYDRRRATYFSREARGRVA